MTRILLPLFAALVAGLSGCVCVEPRGWQPGRTADGCYAEDNCGLYPPYYSTAGYCGEPHMVCPGKRK